MKQKPKTAVQLTIADHDFWLLPGRAMYWPSRRWLLVADTHFGKASLFRERGLPVPTGSSAGDMEMLMQLVKATACQRLIVLGDFLHAAANAQLINRIALWADSLPAALTVILGNHDRHQTKTTSGWPQAWSRIEALERIDEQGIVLAHEPLVEAPGQQPTRQESLWVCGHLHPTTRLRFGADTLRTPVFWHEQFSEQCHQLVLPSFGSFTGGHLLPLSRKEQQTSLFAAGEEAVIALSR